MSIQQFLGALILTAIIGAFMYSMARISGWMVALSVWGIALFGTALIVLAAFLLTGGFG